MEKKREKDAEEESKTVQILLAGLLLKDEPRPSVRELERLIRVKDGILSKLFPQRQTNKRKSKTRRDQNLSGNDLNSKPKHAKTT